MNELAYYLEKYYAELEIQEMLATKETGSLKDHVDGVQQDEEAQSALRDKILSLWNRVKNGDRGAWQIHHKKPMKVRI